MKVTEIIEKVQNICGKHKGLSRMVSVRRSEGVTEIVYVVSDGNIPALTLFELHQLPLYTHVYLSYDSLIMRVIIFPGSFDGSQIIQHLESFKKLH